SAAQGSDPPPCPSERPPAHRHHHRASARLSRRRRAADRGGLRLAGPGLAALRFHHGAGSAGAAGDDPADRACLRPRQYRRRHHQRDPRPPATRGLEGMSSPAVVKEDRRVAERVSSARPRAATARFWRIKSFCRNRAAMIAAIFLSLVALAVIFAPLISGHSPDDADNLARYAPIGTPGYILGTDQQGRDMLARLLYGGRVSLLVGVVPTLTAGVIGLALGLLAGFLRGIIDQVIMRCL